MAANLLTRVKISGWKSFREVEIEFGQLNVLIGSNGSGKSNLLSFFDMFRAATERRLKPYWMTHGLAKELMHYGPKHTPKLRFDIQFESVMYSLWLINTTDGLAGTEHESFSSPADFPAVKEIKNDRREVFESRYVWDLELFDRPRVYQFHDTSIHSRIRGFADLHQTQYLHEDGGNLAAMLYQMQRDEPAHFKEVERQVQSGIPGFSHFVLERAPTGREEVRLEWIGVESDYPMTPNQLSDGSLRWIALCTLLMQPAAWRPGVILIDEPELGLHPALLERLAGLIHYTSVKTQIIIATQSPFLLNFFEPEQIITIDHDGRESRVQRHTKEGLRDWLEEYSMGELWEKHLLDWQPTV